MVEAHGEGIINMKRFIGIGLVGVLLAIVIVNFMTTKSHPLKTQQVALTEDDQRVMQATNFELPTIDGEIMVNAIEQDIENSFDFTIYFH